MKLAKLVHDGAKQDEVTAQEKILEETCVRRRQLMTIASVWELIQKRCDPGFVESQLHPEEASRKRSEAITKDPAFLQQTKDPPKTLKIAVSLLSALQVAINNNDVSQARQMVDGIFKEYLQ